MSIDTDVFREELVDPWGSPDLDPASASDADKNGERGHGMRIVIADDDVLMRSGLARLLERPGHSVVGVAGNPTELLRLVREQHPDLVIVDIQMPPTHTTEGLKAAEQIRLERPDIGIMVLSSHVEVESAAALLESSRGVGYLLRNRLADVDEFFDAVRRVCRGGCVLDPVLVRELMMARHRRDPFALLSRREADVLALMAEGRSNLGIARELWVAEGTVEKHVRSILTKLDLSDSPADHRRVLAVIAFLHARSSGHADDGSARAGVG